MPTLRDRLERLAGRRSEVWVVAAVVAVVVIGGVAMWRRGTEARVAPPAVAPPTTAAVPSSTPSPVAAQGSLLVHVAGAVRRPGLYDLVAGARVADAIEAAGGALRRAQLDALNLAETLADGQKVEVPVPGEGLTGPLPSPAASTASTPVNVNLADQAALESIPGIGPVTAGAILEYRAQIGSFTSIEQLLDVSGIGPATLESMRPYVTL
jgi:competence protein ComEA